TVRPLGDRRRCPAGRRQRRDRHRRQARRMTLERFTTSQQHLRLEASELVLAAAVAHAESIGVAAAIVITDAAGGITSLARLDGTPPISIRHALAKAASASGMKRATDDFVDKRLTTDEVLWRAISGR